MTASVRLTAEQYFAVDEMSEGRCELIEGVLCDAWSGSIVHALLSATVTAIVSGSLRNTPFHLYGSLLRVRLSPLTYAYPDATVICGKPETAEEDRNTVVNPTVVFEVLSPSTADYDRGRKRVLYQGLPTLKTLVLVDPDETAVEVFDRRPDGSWIQRAYSGLDAIIPLPAIGAELPLAELYEGVEFD